MYQLSHISNSAPGAVIGQFVKDVILLALGILTG